MTSSLPIARFRNLCVLAHVDHGKTTICDQLISSNGIIHSRNAGTIRYMDNTEAEQIRGITMKSSSISLVYRHVKPRGKRSKDPSGNNQTSSSEPIPHVINLIDSPGHVDFSTDVSIALRVADGALIVVDVVEGITVQTHALLHQARAERLKPCLVLNKIDRLIVELKCSPVEAYERLCSIVEQANSVMSSLYVKEKMASMSSSAEHAEDTSQVVVEDNKVDDNDDDDDTNHQWLDLDAKEESAFFFRPAAGNVVFCSAIDGWGFRVDQVATQLWRSGKRFGLRRIRQLRRLLWGRFKLNGKTGKIVKCKTGANMFVMFCLRPLWRLYHAVMTHKDSTRVGRVLTELQSMDVARLDASISPLTKSEIKCIDARDVKNESRAIESSALQLQQQQLRRGVLRRTLRHWIPFYTSCLSMVCLQMPNPREAMTTRMDVLFPFVDEDKNKNGTSVIDAVRRCDRSDDAPVVAFVTKMIDVSIERLRGRDGDSGERVLVGFARVFSGVLRTTSDDATTRLFTVDRHGKAELINPTTHLQLYLMMGREFRPVESVSAGAIVAIAGIESAVDKNATICSDPERTPSMARMRFRTQPIVRVAIEPYDASDLPKLERGLARLSASDPCVEYTVGQTGEIILATLGELHLEQSFERLEKHFAGVKLQRSPPLTLFNETVVPRTGTTTRRAETKHDGVGVAAASFTTYLDDALSDVSSKTNEDDMWSKVYTANKRFSVAVSVVSMPPWMQTSLLEDEIGNVDLAKLTGERVVAIGPARARATVLIDRTSDENEPLVDFFESSIVSGFQLAATKGPLCHEPMRGVVFVLLEVEDSIEDDEEDDGEDEDQYGPFGGQIMSAMQNACSAAFLRGGRARLVEPIFRCVLQTMQSYLGKANAVISKRRGKIIDNDLIEGTAIFVIESHIPVAESFGFASELRKKTSGACMSPQLSFSHWALLDIDPFFQPKTLEERETFGETIHAQQQVNLAKTYIDAVRKRKGLPTDEKVVVSAEKQRTLSRKK